MDQCRELGVCFLLLPRKGLWEQFSQDSRDMVTAAQLSAVSNNRMSRALEARIWLYDLGLVTQFSEKLMACPLADLEMDLHLA